MGGGIWTHERSKQQEEAVATFGCRACAGRATIWLARKLFAAATPANLLLEALKEELFQLEIEHQQGKLSPEEYAKARAALEQTLQRALARNRS